MGQVGVRGSRIIRAGPQIHLGGDTEKGHFRLRQSKCLEAEVLPTYLELQVEQVARGAARSRGGGSK